jgi:hypothetical protein
LSGFAVDFFSNTIERNAAHIDAAFRAAQL